MSKQLTAAEIAEEILSVLDLKSMRGVMNDLDKMHEGLGFAVGVEVIKIVADTLIGDKIGGITFQKKEES